MVIAVVHAVNQIGASHKYDQSTIPAYMKEIRLANQTMVVVFHDQECPALAAIPDTTVSAIIKIQLTILTIRITTAVA